MLLTGCRNITEDVLQMEHQLQEFQQVFDQVHSLYIATGKEMFEPVYLLLPSARHFEILDCNNNFSVS